MTPVLEQLAFRIRGELDDLERLVLRVGRAWTRVKQGPADQDLYLDSVALNLHGFYSGLERLFELISRHVDGVVPSGPSWHEDLLHSMASGEEGVRPAVVSEKTAECLDEYRRFRHLVRNVYATNLLPQRLEVLVEQLPELWSTVQSELLSFADFLLAGS